jgi:hypothetical protein
MVTHLSKIFLPREIAITMLLCLVAAAAGCTGKKVPSYKDRIGTVDPATAPNDGDPPTPE